MLLLLSRQQVSLLATARSASSTCSGIGTSGMGLALLTRVVNLSGLVPGLRVNVAVKACWESRLKTPSKFQEAFY